MEERTNRTSTESARSMLYHASIPKELWTEAIVHAAKIRNRFLCPRSNSQISYEMITGVNSSMDHLREFGSRDWVHVAKEERSNLDPRAKKE